jgi:isocitrate dehydrogenase (NAD+)
VSSIRIWIMAARLRTAIDTVLNVDKARTRDLGGTAGTAEFTRALVERIVHS